MTQWNIVADSSCDDVIEERTDGAVRMARVPFVIRVGERDFPDVPGLPLSAMLDEMERRPADSHTSCPSPGTWYEQFRQGEQTIALTISARVSGSFHSAETAREMLREGEPGPRVFGLNTRRAGPGVSLCAARAAELARRGLPWEEAVRALEEYAAGLHTVFALCSFRNLVQNGRVSRAAGFVAGKLGLWGIGRASPEGEIVSAGRARGPARVLDRLVEDMARQGFRGGRVAISHCQDPEMAAALRDRIRSLWSAARVQIAPAGGLCSYYAERHGLIMAY